MATFSAALAFLCLVPQSIPAGFGLSAQAQESAYCRRLRAQIAAAGRRGPGNTARIQRAAVKQQRELGRTAAYAEQLGCNRQRFLFFGSEPPRQCGAINARIARMRANLNRLQGQIHNASYGREEQHRALQATYDANCRPRQAMRRDGPVERGFLDRLFSGLRDPDDPRFREPVYRDMPIEPGPPSQAGEDDPDPVARGGSKAVCVRTCDGGFFPVSYSARRSNLSDLAEMCSALCPNAETKLFTLRPGQEIDAAISEDGEAYSSLSNAGLFKKSFVPSCTCKPANQSWAQALQKAEEMLDNKSKRDLIVTAAKAKELSQPKAPAANKPKKGKRSKESDDEDESERQRVELEKDGQRAAIEAERAKAGIAPGKATHRRNFSLQDGEKLQLKDSDGSTRTVRIIAPKL
ncbi:MAG: DUF2865 domain-containing protein [Beijerinckiaceae bacterium]